MKISLGFADPVSETYRKKLETFWDNILVEGITENRPPIFWFPGMNMETAFKIGTLWQAYDDRYGA